MYLCIRIPLQHDSNIGFLCIYRPPNISITGDLHVIHLIEEFLSLKYQYNVIIGDFNMPAVNWHTLTGPAKFESFLSCVSKNFLKQCVSKSTRPNSGSILDLIFSSLGTNVYNVYVDECFGSSDHSILNFNIQVPRILASEVHVPTRDYKKADWMLFQRLLSEVDWEDTFDQPSIDAVWHCFKMALASIVEVSVPFRKRKPWQVKSYSKIRTALRYTRRCHSRLQSQQTTESLICYMHAKVRLQELINNQTSLREQYVIQSARANPKVYWSYVNSKLKSKQTLPTSIKVGNSILEDPKEIAEALNQHFYDNFNHQHWSMDSVYSENLGCPSAKLCNTIVKFEDVYNTINSLPNKYSEDLNGFSYAILKNGGKVLAKQIVRLFNVSLNFGEIPKDWKKSIIVPIRKKISFFS